MKKKDLLGMMSFADEKYVKEADPDSAAKKHKKSRFKVGLIAACVSCAAVACALYLFLPFSVTEKLKQVDISKYADSEYYELIQKMNTYSLSINSIYADGNIKNNFDRIMSGIKYGNLIDEVLGDSKFEVDEPLYAAPPSYDENESYVEITDNQTAGVTEGDLIKRSDKYIYYLSANTLSIYSINGEESTRIGSYNIYENNKNYYIELYEMYLSQDCRTVIVIAPYYNPSDSTVKTDIIALDVSNPCEVKEKAIVSVAGAYKSSRIANGNILLITSYRPSLNKIDFDNEKTFIPQIDCGNGEESIPADSIISPDELTSTCYTVITMLDETSLDVKDSAAYISYLDDIYVSNSNIYVTRQYTENTDETSKTMTEINYICYAEDKLENKGSISIEGYIKDRYSLDEYNGILRAVTTTRKYGYRKTITSANLYCISLEDNSIIAQVVAFAPIGETVHSVRFDGDAAYVCTAVVVTDPVFFFDLSDLNNITYKDTGNISGFSSSLINLKNGYLLGIGVGDMRGTLKIEVYEETADGVQPVCKYETKETVGYSSDYKSYYIDRENNMVGLGLNTYGKNGTEEEYLLVMFDGYSLRELVKTSLAGEPEYKRAVCIDGYVYMFGTDDFKVIKVF